MFIRSAADDTLQGKAIQEVNRKWGGDFRRWNGRETIGIPVCKKKYAPFDINMKRDEHGQLFMTVERMYGCHCHSRIRRQVIERHGERKGWEPFGQWSLSKAKSMAKKELEKTIIGEQITEEKREIESTSGESCASSVEDEIGRFPPWKQICHNGQCAWKLRGKYDDIFTQIHDRNEYGESEATVRADPSICRPCSGR